MSVAWTTVNDTAIASTDFTAASCTLSFAAGETSKTNTISLLPNAAPADTKTFSVQLSNSNGATISDRTSVSTLLANLPPTPWQQWQSEKFTPTELADSAISGPGMDRDHNGLPNFMEYVLNTDPKTCSASPSISINGGRLTLTFTRNTGATDASLKVLFIEPRAVEGSRLAGERSTTFPR